MRRIAPELRQNCAAYPVSHHTQPIAWAKKRKMMMNLTTREASALVKTSKRRKRTVSRKRRGSESTRNGVEFGIQIAASWYGSDEKRSRANHRRRYCLRTSCGSTTNSSSAVLIAVRETTTMSAAYVSTTSQSMMKSTAW